MNRYKPDKANLKNNHVIPLNTCCFGAEVSVLMSYLKIVRKKRPGVFCRKKVLLEIFAKITPVNFAKFLSITFLQNTSGRLLLIVVRREVFEKSLRTKSFLVQFQTFP